MDTNRRGFFGWLTAGMITLFASMSRPARAVGQKGLWSTEETTREQLIADVRLRGFTTAETRHEHIAAPLCGCSLSIHRRWIYITSDHEIPDVTALLHPDSRMRVGNGVPSHGILSQMSSAVKRALQMAPEANAIIETPSFLDERCATHAKFRTAADLWEEFKHLKLSGWASDTCPGAVEGKGCQVVFWHDDREPRDVNGNINKRFVSHVETRRCTLHAHLLDPEQHAQVVIAHNRSFNPAWREGDS